MTMIGPSRSLRGAVLRREHMSYAKILVETAVAEAEGDGVAECRGDRSVCLEEDT